MASLDSPDHPLAVILREAFETQLESGEVDLIVPEHDLPFEIQADEWTLQIEGWPVTAAFIALDEEPHSLAARQAALDTALDDRSLAGLRRANTLLDNAIAAALEDSGDEVSALLAHLIASPGGDDGDDESMP